MKTIFDRLRKDHDKQRELLSLLVDTSGDTDKRSALFEKLKDELERHAKYEERTLYKPMLEYDNTQPKARHSIAEHKEIDDYLEELIKTDMSDANWLKVAKKLNDRVLHHLEEEEKEIFVSAGHAFTKEQKEDLGEEYLEQMATS